MGEEKLRYGIMCNGKSFQRWQAEVIRDLAKMDNVELSLLIIDSKTAGLKNNSSVLEKVLDKIKRIRPKNFLFQVYNKLFFNPPVKEKVDMSSTLEGTPAISCEVREEGKFSQYFKEDDLQKIDSYNLDFILRFGFGIIRGEIHEVPTYRVWSFHHDNEKKYRGGPPCFWEIYKGDDVTGAILQRLTDRLDGGIVLKKGFFNTVDYSYSKNINQAYMESAKWPSQVCTDILNGNAEYLYNAPTETDAPIYHQPNNFQFIGFLFKLARNFLKKYYGALFSSKWNVGIVDKPIQSFLNSEENKEVHWLPESENRNKFKADSFGIAKEDGLTIAFEDYDYKAEKGCVSGVQLENELTSSSLDSPEPEVLLNQPFPLSYPYLIEHGGEVFCVPESWEANEIALYKVEKFPKQWEKVETLLDDIKGVDATIFQYKETWWLTCTKQENSALNLYIYWSNELTGPWKPHLNNPVKTDVRSSRPAGTPFIHEGNLYRPAQDCSRTYGGRTAINMVKTLTKGDFEETTITYINPYSAYPEAVHTISAVGNKTLVDGRRNVLNLGRFLRLVREKLGIR